MRKSVNIGNKISTFGSLLPQRNFSSEKYRYGFNGKEKDDEVKGIGNSLDFGARIYDPRIGKWLSLDPLMRNYPSLSPYHFSGNNPIMYVDVDGRKFVTYIKVKNEETGKTETQKVTFDGVKTTVQTVQKGALVGTPVNYTGGNDFVDNIIDSYNYIVDNGSDVDNAMQTVASSDVEIEIKDVRNEGSYYEGKIEFDFKYGVEVFDEESGKSLGNQSPALGFWSEVYHAFVDKFDPEAKEKLGDDLQKEENYIHLEKEPQVIDKLKKSNPANKESKRKTYNLEGGDAFPVKTESATSPEKKK